MMGERFHQSNVAIFQQVIHNLLTLININLFWSNILYKNKRLVRLYFAQKVIAIKQ